MTATQLSMEEIVRRYKALYTGAVSDTLDAKGLRNQVLPYYITPVTTDMMVAGPAFTGQGYPVGDVKNDDSNMRIRMLDSIQAGTVSVWACEGHMESAHWGEIMSNAARERGCTGAVVDGGLRDTRFVLKMGFPVFCRFRCAASSIGRWEIREWMVPIKIGHTFIHPGDFVFGDVDGVVIVPQDLTVEVLLETEKVVERENRMRAELSKGSTVSEVYRKYGKF
jgi:4-hydroxy-4-methyl-2-oxoglutarate aldolase